MEQSVVTTDEPPLSPAQHVLQAEFRRRLAYAIESYRIWSNIFGNRPTINESLALLKERPDGREMAPLNLEVEIAIQMLATHAFDTDAPETLRYPTPDEIEAARATFVERMKPI